MTKENKLAKSVNNAAKWSLVTELISKIISPITNMILARILAPEAFGILATVVMVISFSEIFVESGFQKFLIQKEFKSKEEEKEYFNVAFWSNLIFSLFIWGIIIIFNKSLSEFVGNPSLGKILIITGVTIPIYGIIGIQSCQLKKSLNFKKLFYVRIVSSFTPLFITVPLALIGFGYKSLIIGNIAGIALQAIVLYITTLYRPNFYFSLIKLKIMLQAGIWTTLDGIAVWLTAWIDSFLISSSMSGYYMGLYRNSNAMVTSLFSIITASVVPVLFPALSKLQNDPKEFNEMFLKMQHRLAFFLVPIGVGMFLYKDFVITILFGNKWMEASGIVGIMAITTVIRIIFVSIYSEIFRAKGKFKIPLYMQVLDLGFLVPICLFSVRYGFWTLVFSRALAKLPLIIPETIVVKYISGITIRRTLSQMFPIFLSTLLMGIAGNYLQSFRAGILWTIVSIVICMIIYLVIILFFKKEREEIINILKNIK